MNNMRYYTTIHRNLPQSSSNLIKIEKPRQNQPSFQAKRDEHNHSRNINQRELLNKSCAGNSGCLKKWKNPCRNKAEEQAPYNREILVSVSSPLPHKYYQ